MASKKKLSGSNAGDIITQAQAARLLKMTRAGVLYLIESGLLPSVEIAGKRFVYQSDVTKYDARRIASKNIAPKTTKKESKGKK
jgi:hypothetical protein